MHIVSTWTIYAHISTNLTSITYTIDELHLRVTEKGVESRLDWKVINCRALRIHGRKVKMNIMFSQSALRGSTVIFENVHAVKY
jgi:hypothetical protein